MERTGSLPRVVGRYALYDKIAAGGMAAVHIGRLLGPVGFARTVAIKRLHSQFAEEPEFVAMFLDEARLAARISHPNVVPTLDVVNFEGELFLVMHYVPGESLSRLARVTDGQRPRVQPEMAASIMAGVLHGLHAAHEARDERGEPLGIVHRDVSPQNILVGVDGVARVLDFGVAKAVGRLQTTRQGQIKGKLSYMAPEQIRGQPVDRRTDVYAAAVVLWETLTGVRLFGGDNDGEVLAKVLAGKVDPPSKHAPGLPPALDALTLRGLSSSPEDRFATARDLAHALEEAVLPVVASRIGEWVESTAKDVLLERSRLIDRIESDSAVKRVEPPHPRTRSWTTAPVSGRESHEDETSTLHSTASVSTSSHPIPTQPRRRGLASAAVGAAAVIVLFAVFGSAQRRWSASTPPAAPAAGPLAPLQRADVLPEASTLSVPAALSTPSAAPATSLAISAPSAEPRATPTPRARPMGSLLVKPQSSKKPYAYDHM